MKPTLTVAVVAALLMWLMLAAGSTLAFIVIGLVIIGVGVILNYSVELADKELGKKFTTGDVKNSDGLSSAIIAPWLREAGKNIEGSWQYLMEKFPNDYKALTF